MVEEVCCVVLQRPFSFLGKGRRGFGIEGF
jgi:hypothetical protein